MTCKTCGGLGRVEPTAQAMTQTETLRNTTREQIVQRAIDGLKEDFAKMNATAADTLRDVIARLERGGLANPPHWGVMQRIFCTPPRMIIKAFDDLDLNAIAALEREVLLGWDMQHVLMLDGGECRVSLRAPGRREWAIQLCAPTEARARLIALCRARLAEVDAGDAAS